jgi:hypothetical protein
MNLHRRRGVAASHVMASMVLLALGVWALFFFRPAWFPLFQDATCGGGSRWGRATLDLRVLGKTVQKHDTSEPTRLIGASLEPLVDLRYIQQIPLDPWGRAYHFDGELQVLATFGEDGCPGGTGYSQDILVPHHYPYAKRPDFDDADVSALAAELGRRKGLDCRNGWLAQDHQPRAVE